MKDSFYYATTLTLQPLHAKRPHGFLSKPPKNSSPSSFSRVRPFLFTILNVRGMPNDLTFSFPNLLKTARRPRFQGFGPFPFVTPFSLGFGGVPWPYSITQGTPPKPKPMSGTPPKPKPMSKRSSETSRKTNPKP